MKTPRSYIAVAGVLTVFSVTNATPAFADEVRDSQWYLKSLQVSNTRAISTGSGVTVAVVDTGTYPHPDLRRNLLTGTDETTGESGNGQIDEVGHGTSMAALIAAHGRPKGSGIEGIAPGAKILPVRVTRKRAGGFDLELAKGIAWASSKGASVINVSAGAGPSFELQDAVNGAMDKNIVVVAAVGNTSVDAVTGYPAAMDGVLTVGATARNGRHTSRSLKDPKVQICAPGLDIRTAIPKNSYATSNGTSAATAIVSGAAALVRSRFPELSAKDVIHRLTATADDVGSSRVDLQACKLEYSIVSPK